nr:hypothetical protein [Variovorax boronicumulans]
MKPTSATPSPKGPLPHRRWSAPKYPPAQHRQLKKKKGPYDAP